MAAEHAHRRRPRKRHAAQLPPGQALPMFRPMKDCTVLVVEDDQDLRELISEILVSEGFPVHQAENGHVALQLLRGGVQPDVILTNILMPVLDGYELHAELKRHAGWSQIPLIVMTAGRVNRAALSEVEAVMMKPVDLEALLAKVRASCSTKGVARK
jgi:CheY-like chemotaxis protein